MEETLSLIRFIENDSKNVKEEKLAETLIRIKKISEDFEKAEALIKKTLNEKNFNDILMFPEFESKVYLAEGRTTSSINSIDFIKNMKNEGFEKMIPDCVNVVKSKVDSLNNESITKILAEVTQTNTGKPLIAVRKMSKKELKEAL